MGGSSAGDDQRGVGFASASSAFLTKRLTRNDPVIYWPGSCSTPPAATGSRSDCRSYATSRAVSRSGRCAVRGYSGIGGSVAVSGDQRTSTRTPIQCDGGAAELLEVDPTLDRRWAGPVGSRQGRARRGRAVRCPIQRSAACPPQCLGGHHPRQFRGARADRSGERAAVPRRPRRQWLNVLPTAGLPVLTPARRSGPTRGKAGCVQRVRR